MTASIGPRLVKAAAKVRRDTAERDDLIRDAVAGGMSLRDVGRAVRLSHEQVRRITARASPPAEDGTYPIPRHNIECEEDRNTADGDG